MLSKLLWIILVLTLAEPASATLVLYEHSPAEILLASDALITRINADRSLTGVATCKVYRYGDVFFGYSGFWDQWIRAKLKHAAESGSGGIEIMAAFDKIARAEIHRALSQGHAERYAAEMDSGGGNSLDVVLVDPRSHVLVHAHWHLEGDGSISHWRKAYSAAGRRLFIGGKWNDDSRPQKTIEMGALGLYRESMVKGVRRAPGLPFMTGMFERQLAHEESRVATGKRARVGGPVSILRIAGGEAAWVEGHQGACPAVR